MFVKCFCELNVCLDEYELFARPRVAGHYIIRSYYWATPTGEAQFKIRSFIGVRNGIPTGRLLCCTISLASSSSL